MRGLLERFARNGTWLDPTIGSFRFFAPEQWEAILAGFKDVARQIREAGVRILAGTDSSQFLNDRGDPPGESLHNELALLVEAGFTPLEAIRSATWNPAVFLERSKTSGTIEAGKTADLVLLDENPLVRIGNTKRIAMVVRLGRAFKGGELAGLRSKTP